MHYFAQVTGLFTQKPVPLGTIRTNETFLLGLFIFDDSHKWYRKIRKHFFFLGQFTWEDSAKCCFKWDNKF